jgi:hypothetical protein
MECCAEMRNAYRILAGNLNGTDKRHTGRWEYTTETVVRVETGFTGFRTGSENGFF